MTSSRSMYAFKGDVGKSIIKALGLENQRVKRIELVFDVNEPVQMKVYGYASDEGNNLSELVMVLEALDWKPTDV